MTRARFATLWRFLLPIAIALLASAVVTGFADTTARPAWIFGLGIVLGLIGGVSFLMHLLGLAATLPDKRKGRPAHTPETGAGRRPPSAPEPR
ncbi:hypothetical protein [Methyloraptor flagellatus]|uniref:DUF4175 domain-containing protein n=1 Tax=Methyloraptor flagellatus TaxID=3162530 RepID=A0AAU7XEZ1_9HYPH